MLKFCDFLHLNKARDKFAYTQCQCNLILALNQPGNDNNSTSFIFSQIVRGFSKLVCIIFFYVLAEMDFQTTITITQQKTPTHPKRLIVNAFNVDIFKNSGTSANECKSKTLTANKNK